MRGGEAEGFSIPAQREACLRKAASLGAVVIDEFVDAGESARSANRPELKRLLKCVASDPVEYVIVHKVDRLARNRADDVEINLALKAAGVTLVSCTENIDETPSGILLHGIMSSIAEFYSRNLASEVIKGATQKAKNGGTIGKAPTGYLNVRRMENGREIRTVQVDPERGPLMQWAFEQYATGEWTIRNLLEAVTEKGLTSTGGPRTPSKPLSLSNFNRLLKTPYYKGIVTYRGVEYPGNHEPLVSAEIYQRVQDVLDAHDNSGEKQRIHQHYLKGSVFCGQCGSRLSIMNSKNRWGVTYPYFFCLGRQSKRTGCTQSVVLIDLVEQAIEDHYATKRLTADERVEVEAFILDELAKARRQADEERARMERRIKKLTDEREKLLQAHYADAIPMELLRTEQARIGRELEQADRLLTAGQLQSEALVVTLGQALSFAENCHGAYLDANPQVRRQLNQAFFERLEINADYEVTSRLAMPYDVLLGDEVRQAAQEHARDSKVSKTSVYRRERPGRARVRARNDNTPVFAGVGSSNDWLVGEGGLEPPRPCGHWHLKPARLPFRHSPE